VIIMPPSGIIVSGTLMQKIVPNTPFTLSKMLTPLADEDYDVLANLMNDLIPAEDLNTPDEMVTHV
jgi:hypothetical protein